MHYDGIIARFKPAAVSSNTSTVLTEDMVLSTPTAGNLEAIRFIQPKQPPSPEDVVLSASRGESAM